ncbi:MAG: divalent-cation tolerance protein CutA [Candidatus Omnitrophota bacterium]|nr:divalent-cation tolerance protein CutA [Candidatus Omnitrophota bacterium]
MKQTSCVVVLTTCPNRTVARRIATALVTKRLAACVNLLPGIESTFRWEGKIDRANEVLLVIKTTRRRFGALARAIKHLHPYEVPEIIALPVTIGAAPYLRWLSQSVALR